MKSITAPLVLISIHSIMLQYSRFTRFTPDHSNDSNGADGIGRYGTSHNDIRGHTSIGGRGGICIYIFLLLEVTCEGMQGIAFSTSATLDVIAMITIIR